MCGLMNPAYILTLSCPDRTGIVHAVSGFLLERGGNIEEAAQYNDHGTGLFFMRVRFACGQLTQDDLRTQLKMFAQGFQSEDKNLLVNLQPQALANDGKAGVIRRLLLQRIIEKRTNRD